MMTDSGFPIIAYDARNTSRQWGHCHGESFRTAIAELVEIRTNLMREKNPTLTTSRIEELAAEQWVITQKFDADLAEELLGISEGCGSSLTDLIILNNYTDFRDIQPIEDQGCSLVFVKQTRDPLVGQTWDMHGSAKRYVCVLDIPAVGDGHRTLAFSLVGCVGMMGFTSRGTVMGVNNINTNGAQAGVLWPCVVRQVLKQPTLQSMTERLTSAAVTSGHNYLLSDGERAEMWEVAPELSERVSHLELGKSGYLFHTNHCLGTQVAKRETTISQNSTTHIRHDLLEKKLPDIKTFDQVYDLMHDHEGYPKSICSNFQTNAQDPSITCGGAVGHLNTGEVVMWRGDKVYDDNFVEHRFQLEITH